MQKGDSVIANHPESGSRESVRSYGIVQEMTKSGDAIIKLADGSLITRQINSVAVYIQPPANWLELFRQQQTVYSHPRQHMIARRSTPQKLDMYEVGRQWWIPNLSTFIISEKYNYSKETGEQ